MPPEAAEALKRAKEGGQMQSAQADKSMPKGSQP